MKIISVLNEKGGTGKSTVATNLATALHREGKRVVLLDCDPQGTARDWRDASPDDADLPPVLGVDRPQMLASSLNGINAEIAIIDSPAKAESIRARLQRCQSQRRGAGSRSRTQGSKMALTVKPLNKVRESVPVKEVAKPSQAELVRVNLEVEKETRQHWRMEAIKRGLSLKELIQQAMELHLK